MRRSQPPALRQALCFACAALWFLPAAAQVQRGPGSAAQVWAGAARVEITHPAGPPVNDPLFVRALVYGNQTTTAVIVTVDAVAIGEIGSIGNDYLSTVRAAVQRELKIAPSNILVNASHCHGVVCPDVADRTIRAIKEAFAGMVPVTVGAGSGREDRVMENRRVRLKNGREADVRHAYALSPDEEVVGTGPIDPEIGVLRFDDLQGKTLAVLYNYAGHPIQGAPNGGNTADITGFSSGVIEEALSPGAVALFIQGCGGDINPIWYKDVTHPRDGRPLGNQLGLSTLNAVKKIVTKPEVPLRVINEKVKLPRANLAPRIQALQAERDRLVATLTGTSLNLKTFLPLVVRYQLSPDFPSYASHRYHHETALGRTDLVRMDAENRRNIAAYMKNILAMEEITRLQTNLALLQKHHQNNLKAGPTIEVEIVGLRIGEFFLVSFPGEPTVQIGLNIKQSSPHDLTFVAGYSNGYIYYAPTADQLRNAGGAQEDSDCLLAPEWQAIYEAKAAEMLRGL